MWILFPWVFWLVIKETMVVMEEQSGHVGQAHRRRMVETATDAQRSDELLFQAVTSEFPIGAAADLLRDELNLGLADLKSLAEIHELKHSELGGYSPKRTLPIALTLFTLAANIVPEEAFEYFGWSNYSQYQAYVFVLTVGTLLYLGLIYLPLILKSQRLEAASNHRGLLLNYMVALDSSIMKSDSQAESH
jgi:hypothetical protein